MNSTEWLTRRNFWSWRWWRSGRCCRGFWYWTPRAGEDDTLRTLEPGPVSRSVISIVHEVVVIVIPRAAGICTWNQVLKVRRPSERKNWDRTAWGQRLKLFKWNLNMSNSLRHKNSQNIKAYSYREYFISRGLLTQMSSACSMNKSEPRGWDKALGWKSISMTSMKGRRSDPEEKSEKDACKVRDSLRNQFHGGEAWEKRLGR